MVTWSDSIALQSLESLSQDVFSWKVLFALKVEDRIGLKFMNGYLLLFCLFWLPCAL